MALTTRPLSITIRPDGALPVERVPGRHVWLFKLVAHNTPLVVLFPRVTAASYGPLDCWTGEVSASLSAFPLLPPPPSESSRAPRGLALLCDTKIANPDLTLIEHWKQDFYKEADLLFITSHSLLFFLTHISLFHRAPVPDLHLPLGIPWLGCVCGSPHFPLYYVGKISVDRHIDIAGVEFIHWLIVQLCFEGTRICNIKLDTW